MEKLYFTFLLIFFSYSNCTKCDDVTNPQGPNDCKGLELSGEYDHCCYLRRKYNYQKKPGLGEDFSTCVGGKGLEWVTIMDDMKKMKIDMGFTIEEWDCQCFKNSNYISISILSIILLFLLL